MRWLRQHGACNREATPLRFGRGFHYGPELYNARISSDLAIECVTGDYRTCPDWADPIDWAVEGETLQTLLLGHFWRYQEDNIKFVADEQSFEIPLVNPSTGRPSQTFRLPTHSAVLSLLILQTRYRLRHHSTLNTFITSSPRWLIAFTAIRPQMRTDENRHKIVAESMSHHYNGNKGLRILAKAGFGRS